METSKGQTFRQLREKRPVSPEVKEQLKNFNKTKKAILNALGEGEQTIAQLSEKLSMPTHEVVYYLMSLLKYGFVQKGELDDMDEYFTYKLTKQ